MQIIVGRGSDAGYWVLGPNGWHHVPGWNPEAMIEFERLAGVLQAAAGLRAPGVAEEIGRLAASSM